MPLNTKVASASTASSGMSNSNAADARFYGCDPVQLQNIRKSVPWTKDAKFFKNVAMSPSSIMKIMMHCYSGVEKGIAKGGNPIEVMGLLLGRPDPITPETLVVTDAFALPIEGFETRVIADDEQVVNHMIALGESLEKTRNEKFMGWYHSHPFDVVPDRSHCFLSQTDLSTQLQWQRAEDPHGNPFVAIVVDPLRSALLEQPQIKAFRAFPPEYQSPVANECPNGTIEVSEQARLEQWGSCWNRYYELQIEYYMSSTSRKVLEQLTQEYLWIRTLQRHTPVDASVQAISSAAQQVSVALSSAQSGSSVGGSSSSGLASFRPPPVPSQARGGGSSGEGMIAGPGGLLGPGMAAAMGGTMGIAPPRANKEWNKAIQQLVEAAANEACETNLQQVKDNVFR